MPLLHRWDIEVWDTRAMVLAGDGKRYEIDLVLIIKRLAWQGGMTKGN